jgi:hypothetical protein
VLPIGKSKTRTDYGAFEAFAFPSFILLLLTLPTCTILGTTVLMLVATAHMFPGSHTSGGGAQQREDQ